MLYLYVSLYIIDNYYIFQLYFLVIFLFVYILYYYVIYFILFEFFFYLSNYIILVYYFQELKKRFLIQESEDELDIIIFLKYCGIKVIYLYICMLVLV